MQPIQYMTSLLTFYLKGEIRQEQNFVNLKEPNTILRLIPLGSKKDSIPVSQLSSVEIETELDFRSLIIGAVSMFISFCIIYLPYINEMLGLRNILLGLFCLLFGINLAISAFETTLCIKTTSGHTKVLFFLIFDKSKAILAEKQIRQIISDRLDDTNNRIQGDRQTDRIVEAINKK